MNKFNHKGERHGPWEEYHPNGNLWYKTNYINGKEHGLSEDYYYFNGNLMYKGTFVNGKKHGLCERYNYDGKLHRKEYHL